MPFPLLIPAALAAGGALIGGLKGGWGGALQGGLIGGSLGFGGAGLAGAGAAGAGGAAGGAGLLAPTSAGAASALGAGISSGAGTAAAGGAASAVGAANAGSWLNKLGPGLRAFNALQGGQGPQMLSTPPLQHIPQSSPLYNQLMQPQQPQANNLQVPTSYVPPTYFG